MQKPFDEERIIGKIHPFGDGVFEDKNLFVFRENGFFKAFNCVSNDIVLVGYEMNIRVVLFNVIEPKNDTVTSGVVSGDVKMISMYV